MHERTEGPLATFEETQSGWPTLGAKEHVSEHVSRSDLYDSRDAHRWPQERSSPIMSQSLCQRWRGPWAYAIATAVAVLIAACGKPEYPSSKPPSLQATISADGMMVAALDRTDTAAPTLFLFDLRFDDRIEARELPVPPFTNGIRFGLRGYELLLTHLIGDRSVGDLVKWDLSEPRNPPKHVYRGVALNFPLELQPGMFLVRTCTPPEDDPGTCMRWGVSWILVTENGEVDQAFAAKESAFWQSWPNYLSGAGVYWANERAHRASPSAPPKDLPHFVKEVIPGGQEPDTSHLERLGEDARDFACDHASLRCLRVFIANWGQTRGDPYRYDVDVVFGDERCTVDNGDWSYIAGQSVTPDGRAAVLTVADEYAGPRRVVVLRFDDDQCGPIEMMTIFDQRNQE